MIELTQEQIDFINRTKKIEAESLPREFRFPTASGKMGGPEPAPGEWVYDYHLFRKYEKPLTPEKIENKLIEFNKSETALADKFRGCLLGLALGDALGTTNEFRRRGSFEPITDIIGGGPFDLEAGDWTDDTSMAYCLGFSLLRKNGFNPKDQMDVYTMWWKRGAFSVNGRCFDIGSTVKQALEKYETTAEPFAGSRDPMSAGNGSIMRLAPVPLFYYSNPEDLVYFSGESSRTTHGNKECISACHYLAAIIHAAINGMDKEEICSSIITPYAGCWDKFPLTPKIKDIAEGSYLNKDIDKIKSSGYVVDTLEAALWCFHNSNDFASGALLAANLGGDTDSIAAVYGQIAGAYYGEINLPIEWLDKLSRNHIFYIQAEDLYNHYQQTINA